MSCLDVEATGQSARTGIEVGAYSMDANSRDVLILSSYHDYRTSKRASIHAVADGLVRLGYRVNFISTRYSFLSRMTGDSRNFLWSRANEPEHLNGVECYLWRTILHPFASRRDLVSAAMSALFPLYARLPNRYFDWAIRRASYIIIESSVAAIYLERIRRLNRNAKVIYYATDRLDTIGAHPFVKGALSRFGSTIDHCALRSPRMAPDFEWARGRLFRAEFGIHPPDFQQIGPSPFTDRLNAVSVGSMLFDASFFTAVAPLFPNVQFHIIGCGTQFDPPSENVTIYPEMEFQATLPYVKHATFGIAPYRPAPGSDYLAESSLKLAQYEYLGLPAVCPDFAAGTNTNRFGYVTGDIDSMERAVQRALDHVGSVTPRRFLTWDEVAERVLDPDRYPETALTHNVQS